MLHIKRNSIPAGQKPGRIQQRAVATDMAENTSHVFAGFATFSYKYGRMATHRHYNEYMIVIDAKDAVVAYGNDLNDLKSEPLCAGQIIRPVAGEWHRFDFTSDEGYVDFLNYFIQFPPRMMEEDTAV